MTAIPHIISVAPGSAGQTLAAVLRKHLAGQSWSQIRAMVAARRVRLNGEMWLDSARRVKEGDTIEILEYSPPKPSRFEKIVIRYIDEHLVVVEKPSGISTVRHPTERDWTVERRELVPTLDDLVLRQIGSTPNKKNRGLKARLRIVHRLDKETSGLVVFARSVEAERGLGHQFRRHSVTRKYLAIAVGDVASQTVHTFLVRDRGDGRRGSLSPPLNKGGQGGAFAKEAITHINALEKLTGYTLVSCRLETGRTHQIRIHLSELGHPVCGEKVYKRPLSGPPIEDKSGAPRLALHAAELGFEHPVSGEPVHWEMPLPADLKSLRDRLAAPRREARPPRSPSESG